MGPGAGKALKALYEHLGGEFHGHSILKMLLELPAACKPAETLLETAADLLVILERSSERFIDRIPRFQRLFIEASVPVDVFPYTEAETRSVSLARQARREGLILA